MWSGCIPGSGFDYGGTITQCQYSMRPQLDTGITESWPDWPSAAGWTKEKEKNISFNRFKKGSQTDLLGTLRSDGEPIYGQK